MGATPLTKGRTRVAARGKAVPWKVVLAGDVPPRARSLVQEPLAALLVFLAAPARAGIVAGERRARAHVGLLFPTRRLEGAAQRQDEGAQGASSGKPTLALQLGQEGSREGRGLAPRARRQFQPR